MRRFVLVVLGVLAAVLPGAAQERPRICFGNEPSWGVDLTTPASARLSFPGAEGVAYRGAIVRNEPIREGIWRGTSSAGRDLVVFLRDGACSDGMSDTTHPVSARVSLPDGRFLAGCCRVSGAQPAAATAALEGPGWRLTGMPGRDAAALAALPRPVRVRFERGRVTGSSGCNNVMGGYTLAGDRLTLGPLAGSMMACPEPGMSIENAFKAAFAGTLRYAIKGDRLSLTSEGGATLSFEKEPAPRLEGVTWQTGVFNNNRQAVISLLTGTRIAFTFADGMVSGNSGCNDFRAPYTAEPGRITIGPVSATSRTCGEDVMTQERQFLAALTSAVKWAVEADELDMHRGDEQRALTARAAAR